MALVSGNTTTVSKPGPSSRLKNQITACCRDNSRICSREIPSDFGKSGQKPKCTSPDLNSNWSSGDIL